MPGDDRWEQFDGYDAPRYTPVPDDLFDWQLADLGLAELKVLLFIIRKTLGYKKDGDAISLTQICEATGLRRKAVSQAIRTLEERRAIRVLRRKSPRGDAAINLYTLNIRGEGGGFLEKPRWFPQETTVVSSGNQQEQILQEQNIQESKIESPPVENSVENYQPKVPAPRRPSGDSLSTIKQIARQASELLDTAEQYRSILGFLKSYDPDVASEALQATLQRMTEEPGISNPVAYFYTVVKARQEAKNAAALSASQREAERRRVAVNWAQQLIREWGEHQARCILLDTYRDEKFVDSALRAALHQ